MTDYFRPYDSRDGDIDKLVDAVDDRDRVIARLLDGWWPVLGDPPKTEGPLWFERFGNGIDSMSDGEAAIIRAHQERNQ
jgi:hypothetical protein